MDERSIESKTEVHETFPGDYLSIGKSCSFFKFQLIYVKINGKTQVDSSIFNSMDLN